MNLTRQEEEKAQEEKRKEEPQIYARPPRIDCNWSSGAFFVYELLSGALPQPSAHLQFSSVYQLLCSVIRYA